MSRRVESRAHRHPGLTMCDHCRPPCPRALRVPLSSWTSQTAVLKLYYQWSLYKTQPPPTHTAPLQGFRWLWVAGTCTQSQRPVILCSLGHTVNVVLEGSRKIDVQNSMILCTDSKSDPRACWESRRGASEWSGSVCVRVLRPASFRAVCRRILRIPLEKGALIPNRLASWANTRSSSCCRP